MDSWDIRSLDIDITNDWIYPLEECKNPSSVENASINISPADLEYIEKKKEEVLFYFLSNSENKNFYNEVVYRYNVKNKPNVPSESAQKYKVTIGSILSVPLTAECKYYVLNE